MPKLSKARLALLVVAAAPALATAGNPIAGLPTLTTARQAHSLTSENASLHFPVHLQAVVTYYDPYIDQRRGALFVHDSTGAVFAAVPLTPILALQPGTLVDLWGVSGPGDFAPIVLADQIRVIGQSHVPLEAPRVSLARMLSGVEDGQWVEIEGVVHSIVNSGRNVTLNLTISDGIVRATTV